MSLRSKIEGRHAARRAVGELVDAHVARRLVAGHATPGWMRVAAVRLRMRAWRKGALTLAQLGDDLAGVFAQIADMGPDAARDIPEE